MKRKMKSILSVLFAVIMTAVMVGNHRGNVVSAEEETEETYTCSLAKNHGAIDSNNNLVENDVYCLDRTLDEPESENVFTRIRLSELDGYTKMSNYVETEVPVPENMKIRLLKVLAGGNEIREFLDTWNNPENIADELEKNGGYSEAFTQQYEADKTSGKTNAETVREYFMKKIDSLEKIGESHLIWLATVQDSNSFAESIMKMEEGRYYKRNIELYKYPYSVSSDIPSGKIPEEVIYDDPMSAWNVYFKRIATFLDEEVADYYSMGYDAYVYQSDSMYTQNVIGAAFIDTVFVSKIDQDGKALGGAALQILDDEDKIVKEWSSDEERHRISGLKKNTEYTLRESSAPEGYLPVSDIIFTINDDGMPVLKESVSEDEVKVEGREIYVIDAEEEVPEPGKQDITGRIEFEKVNENHPDKKLEGATYGLFRSVDSYREEGENTGNDSDGQVPEDLEQVMIDGEKYVLLTTVVTDKDGKAAFDGLLTDITYLIKELKAPDGYYLSKNPLKVSLADNRENGKTELDINVIDDGDGTVSVDGDKITWLEPEILTEVSKVDEEGKPVVGAKLHIEDEDGTVIISWTTENVPKKLEAVLKAGQTYKLVEDSAPAGYKTAEAMTFKVSEEMGPDQNEMIDLKMIDEKIPDNPLDEDTNETDEDTTETKEDTTETVDDVSETVDGTSETVEDTTGTVDGTSETGDRSPKTGDDAPIGAVVLAMIFAAAGIFCLLSKKTRAKDTN